MIPPKRQLPQWLPTCWVNFARSLLAGRRWAKARRWSSSFLPRKTQRFRHHVVHDVLLQRAVKEISLRASRVDRHVFAAVRLAAGCDQRFLQLPRTGGIDIREIG